MSAETSVAWVVQGRPTALAKSAVKILEQAGDEGLNPSDYDASTLSKDVAAASQGAPLSVAKQTELDSSMTQSLLRYLHDFLMNMSPAMVY
jgi:murein L,D-transpeptidase YcbB/YkuD